MRTDAKVGLVGAFAVVLAVVCYFTLHDKNRNVINPVSSTPNASTSETPNASGSPGSTGSLSVSLPPTTAPSANAAPDLSSSPSMPSPSGGSLLGPSVAYGQSTPSNNLGGTVILPPGASSQPAPAPTVSIGPAPSPSTGTLVTPGGNNSLNNSLSGSMNAPLIPSPSLTTPGSPSSPGLSTSPLSQSPTDSSTSSILPPSSPFSSPSNNSLTTGTGKTSKNGKTSTHGTSPKPAHPTPTIDLTDSTPTPSANLLSGSSSGAYSIAKGDTLGVLAKRNGVSVKSILAANPGVNPNRLKVGQKIKIPAKGTGTAASRPASSSRNATTRSTTTKKAKASASATRATLAKGGTYTIHKGDTLRKIAKSMYGDENMWRRIFRINRGDLASPNDITVGEVIKLPPTK